MNKITILIAIGILLADYYEGKNCKEKKHSYLSIFRGIYLCPSGELRGYLK